MEFEGTYRLIEHKRAIKFLKNQSADFQERVFKAYQEILENPFSNRNSIPLKGIANRYRKKIGDFRIIYEVRKKELLIVIVDIDSRGQVYNRV
ncbi:MAG: type II toxin-antitoxin system RelE/ParE family toxin [Clostridia bacterium]|nr:type II toxin-antitoxin system RelE/ParE family toxin [Clostridia bacterium]